MSNTSKIAEIIEGYIAIFALYDFAGYGRPME